ncbi:MAG: hypothetical protein ACRYG8_10335 [Janthinobacterium lividum]
MSEDSVAPYHATVVLLSCFHCPGSSNLSASNRRILAMSMPSYEPRLLTPYEVGAIVRLYREEFIWTQETLAELSGIT